MRPLLPGAILALLSGALAAPRAPVAAAAPPSPDAGGANAVDPARELFVVDPGVVDDPLRTGPGGAWHFGTLFARLAGAQDPARFAEAWLATLIEAPVVNGVAVLEPGKAADFREFRNAWRAQGGGPAVDLSLAPFRLCAIVHRPDLVRVGEQGVQAYGEARFVYCAVDPASPATTATNFFVIFEFELPASGCAEVLSWARAWHALGALPLGGEAYNAALERLTDLATRPDLSSGRPNGSRLAQLRTNEFELGDHSFHWNLREWRLRGAPGSLDAALEAATTRQTPHWSLLKTANGRTVLAEYLDSERERILAGTHVVPDVFASASFGERSFATGNAINFCGHPKPHPSLPCATKGTLWWAPGYQGLPEQPDLTVEDAEVRHRFALQTCSGCHFFETGLNIDGVSSFSMVAPRLPGSASRLASFLTGSGGPIADPVAPRALDAAGNLVRVEHRFGDLARRRALLERMLALDCAAEAEALEELGAIAASTGTRVH